MKSSILREKAYSFALEAIKVYKKLTSEQREFILSKQFLRSATSIGANIREASAAQSSRDFLAKVSIALKESNETDYWIRLLVDSNCLENNFGEKLIKQNEELIKMLSASVKTIRERIAKN